MNKNTTKIFVLIISLLLIIIFVLAILGFTNIINFWIAAVLTGVFAFLVLPELNKHADKQSGKSKVNQHSDKNKGAEFR